MGEAPSENPVPRKETEVKRSAGGASSGAPPRYRVATDFDDRKNPVPVPAQERHFRVQPCDLFVEAVNDIDATIEALHAFGNSDLHLFRSHHGVAFERANFVELLGDRLSCVRSLIRSVIDSSLMSLDSIDHVLVNGMLATSHLVRSVIASCVPGKNVVILNPERASCFGAIMHARVLAGLKETPNLTDVLTQPLHVQCGNSLQELLPIGSMLPTATKILVSSADTPVVMQSSASINDVCLVKVPFTATSNLPLHEDCKLLVAIDRDGLVNHCELS